MYSDLLEILKEFVKKLLASRLFILGVFFTFLFGVLTVRLFELQIISGEEYQENYMAKTERSLSWKARAEIFTTETETCWRTISFPTM